MLKHKVLFIALILLSLVVGSDDRRTDLQRILLEADRFAMLYNWPKAAPLYAEAQSLSARSGDLRNELIAQMGYLFVTADREGSSENAETVDAILRLPLVQSDARLKLRALLAKALIERDINESSAKASWQTISQLAQQLGDKSWQVRANAEIGQILYMEGNVSAATTMFRDALGSMYLRLDLAAAIYYTAMVGNGAIESGRPETGLQYCSFALRLAGFAKDSGFPFMAYQGKARALLALNRRVEAEAVLSEAIATARKDQNFFALTQLLVVAGGAEASHDVPRAIGYLKEATEIAKQQGFHHVYAWSAWQLARIYRDTDAFGEADVAASEAITVMRKIEDREHLPFHLALLADVKAQKGDYKRADQLYSQATDVIEALLVNVNSREIEASLMDTLSDVYVGHFKVAAKSSNAEKAYDIIEQARGRTLADTLRGNRETLSDSKVNLDAQRRINSIQAELLHEQDPAVRRSLLDTLFVTEQLLRPVHTTAAAAKLSERTSLGMLRHSLHFDEMVLEYVLAEPKSYCLRITRSAAKVIVLGAGRKRIDTLVEKYLSSIRGGDARPTAGDELYSILLKPVVGAFSKKRIIVVPDGHLHLLPFDALRDDRGRYVLESHIVTYVPSATVLTLLRQTHSRHQFTGNFLGVGDVLDSRTLVSPSAVPNPNGVVHAFFDTTKLPRLPMSREEVMNASTILGGNNRVLLGDRATEAAFKASPLADFRVIHLAVHGVADSEFPDRAALVLGAQAGEDGLLQVREIQDLPIHSELVTLSACDTGAGRLLGEEGITNLEQAFLLAGARSVIASVWTADDFSTAALMKSLYAHLADGDDKSAALRQAKLDFLAAFGDKAIPAYWAGFTLVGDGSTGIFTQKVLAYRK